MLLKKLESFFLLLVLGFFVFSCDVDNPNQTPTLVNPTPTNNVVSIELLGVDKIGKSRFVFMGKLDENPINIPEDSAGLGIQRIELGATGILEISVNAYSIETGELTATGSGSQEISTSETSFEIQLKLANPVEGFYLTFNNEGEETKFLYYKDEFVDKLPAPKKDGYLFNGWFTMANGNGTKLESNSYKMTADLTVYAYWVATNPDTKYTVTFETNGGSAVAEQIVTAGDVINAPAEPTKTGYIFAGWYFDSSYNTLASFPYSVTNHVTLYAKWVKKSDIVKVTGVTLNKASLSFVSADISETLSAIIAPANATNKSVTWTSSDPSVATVNNGTVTALAAGSATITVTTADGGFTETCSVTVSSDPNQTVSALILTKASSSTKEIPAFTVTAKYSDRTTEEITSKVTWNSTDTAVATVAAGGTVTLVAAGKTEVTATYEKKESNKATVTVMSVGGSSDSIYLIPGCWDADSAKYAVYFWDGAVNETLDMTLDSTTGYYVCTPSKKWANAIFKRLSPSGSKETWDKGAALWNKTVDLAIPSDSNTYEISGWGENSGSWKGLNGAGGGTLTAEVTVDVPLIPDVPTVNIKPASGEISLKGNIEVDYVENNATVTVASVTISGAVSKTYSLSDFSSNKISISVEKLGLKAGDTITVNASATNSEGTTTATPVTLTVKDVPPPPPVIDTFTWDNALVYFVLTDRFYDGDSKNNYSYYRQNANKGFSGPNVATFHGGDIVGMTQKLDYLDDLGVNAIWITAPYEQIHGWVSGKNDQFPHFSFHGYYAQDWTFMDQNMGTIEEFRTFVDEAHKRGIRIVMDVVMNHTGYNTYEDMITYDFGGYTETAHGWLSQTEGKWGANAKVTDWTTPWSKWWGCWVRAFKGQYGFATEGSGDLTGQLAGLPDVVTESTTTVSIPAFLRKKWDSEVNNTSVVGAGNTTGNTYKDYQLPSISNVDWYNKSGDWRADSKGAPADYLVMWLSAWVREFGIDGFRCDTAKHVDMYRWGQLKDACQSALEAWRNDSSKEDTAGAKDWDESFWMTGECFGWNSTAGQGDYYTTGKFDSMINFSFNGSQWGGSGSSGSTPTTDTWGSYLSINNNFDSDGNGNRNNALSYVSSHDTGLHRPGDQVKVGTMLCLLPGGVQIYYGDESSRPAVNAYGDTDMATRGDMNFGSDTSCVSHWGKVGTFRKYNPAVGAGTGSATKRTYNGTAGESKVAIGISGTSVDVSGLFADGVTVYNWYDGKSATVSGGKVTFVGGTTSQPILVSDRNPADYGVTF